MAATTPDEIRATLQEITAELWAEIDAVALAYQTQAQQRSALFSAAPLLIAEYQSATSALALDWYDELRDLAAPRKPFTPQPVVDLREAKIGNAVAWATDLPGLDTDAVLARLHPVMQKEATLGFWESITDNVKDDPDSVGWRRFTRGPAACPFCRMLADKGAVYSADTARFAAHKSCHCVAAPDFGTHTGEPASAMQYLASKKRRSAHDRALLREYLKANYGA